VYTTHFKRGIPPMGGVVVYLPDPVIVMIKGLLFDLISSKAYTLLYIIFYHSSVIRLRIPGETVAKQGSI
jgi:hypothetical protein